MAPKMQRVFFRFLFKLTENHFVNFNNFYGVGMTEDVNKSGFVRLKARTKN